MKKVTLLVWALMAAGTAQADALTDTAGKVLDKEVSVNAGVGHLEQSNVNATADAQQGGTAGAGGVVAHQKTNGGLVSVNAGVGILKNSSVTANATAKGQGSQAHAGGVVATQQ